MLYVQIEIAPRMTHSFYLVYDGVECVCTNPEYRSFHFLRCLIAAFSTLLSVCAPASRVWHMCTQASRNDWPFTCYSALSRHRYVIMYVQAQFGVRTHTFAWVESARALTHAHAYVHLVYRPHWHVLYIEMTNVCACRLRMWPWTTTIFVVYDCDSTRCGERRSGETLTKLIRAIRILPLVFQLMVDDTKNISEHSVSADEIQIGTNDIDK